MSSIPPVVYLHQELTSIMSGDRGLTGIATKVAEEITHKDIDGDGRVGSTTASAVVNMAEGQTGIDLNGDGRIAGGVAHGVAPSAHGGVHGGAPVAGVAPAAGVAPVHGGLGSKIAHSLLH